MKLLDDSLISYHQKIWVGIIDRSPVLLELAQPEYLAGGFVIFWILLIGNLDYAPKHHPRPQLASPVANRSPLEERPAGTSATSRWIERVISHPPSRRRARSRRRP